MMLHQLLFRKRALYGLLNQTMAFDKGGVLFFVEIAVEQFLFAAG